MPARIALINGLAGQVSVSGKLVIMWISRLILALCFFPLVVFFTPMYANTATDTRKGRNCNYTENSMMIMVITNCEFSQLKSPPVEQLIEF